MEKLTALAVVTQQVLPRFVQETAADRERTCLDLERSRMAAEDRSGQIYRTMDRMDEDRRQLQEEVEDIWEENEGLIREDSRHNERMEALRRVMMTAIDERTEAVYDRNAAVERLRESERTIRELQHESGRLKADREQSSSHQCADTEVEARRKFLKRCR